MVVEGAPIGSHDPISKAFNAVIQQPAAEVRRVLRTLLGCGDAGLPANSNEYDRKQRFLRKKQLAQIILAQERIESILLIQNEELQFLRKEIAFLRKESSNMHSLPLLPSDSEESESK